MSRIIAKRFYRAEAYRSNEPDVAGWLGVTSQVTGTGGPRVVEEMIPIRIGASCPVPAPVARRASAVNAKACSPVPA